MQRNSIGCWQVSSAMPWERDMYMYLEDFKFANIDDFKKANFFLGKSDLLFALSVDFPGLYKMPMAYVAAVRTELKRLGFQVERGKLSNSVFTYKLFYFGPRLRASFGPLKCDATAFKVYFYGFPDSDSVVKGGK